MKTDTPVCVPCNEHGCFSCDCAQCATQLTPGMASALVETFLGIAVRRSPRRAGVSKTVTFVRVLHCLLSSGPLLKISLQGEILGDSVPHYL